MKPTAGPARAHRAAPRPPAARLNLRRAPAPEEENGLDDRPSHFWRWFALIFFLHVALFVILFFVFNGKPATPPPEFISLVNPGDLAKGAPGVTAAPKLGPTTPAPSHTAVAPPPEAPPPPSPAKPKIHPEKPAALKPPPIVKDDAPPIAPPVPKPKPAPPKPKVKVDLSHLVDAPDADAPAPPPKLKPKPHVKKTIRPPDETPTKADAAESETDGLSKDQVAAALGAKLKKAGSDKGVVEGPSGAVNGKANPFGDFYASLHDQVMNKWTIPNSSDETATDPVVRIHVERDGRVPPERVTLERSSNNRIYDDSALAAARSLGYTLQPLPDGCPPDISITFKPNR